MRDDPVIADGFLKASLLFGLVAELADEEFRILADVQQVGHRVAPNGKQDNRGLSEVVAAKPGPLEVEPARGVGIVTRSGKRLRHCRAPGRFLFERLPLGKSRPAIPAPVTDLLPVERVRQAVVMVPGLESRNPAIDVRTATRSEEHTSELQSLAYLVCRLLLEKKK